MSDDFDCPLCKFKQSKIDSLKAELDECREQLLDSEALVGVYVNTGYTYLKQLYDVRKELENLLDRNGG